MSPRARLAQVLALLLAPGCPRLDDEACLIREPDQECPSEEEARDELVGDRTCESPMRRVIATGELLYEQEVQGLDPAELEKKCCYEAAYRTLFGQGCVEGRPLRVEGEIVTARPLQRPDWADALVPDPRGLTEAEKALLAEAWTRVALLEHASVPAFARVVLDLVALAAPAELLERTARAMGDEVAHARACFALAGAYGGTALGPGPLPVPPHRVPTLEALALETFEEGCVGETLAAALAAVQLEGATDGAVRRVLGQIVQDEARHAELAWDIVSWAVGVGGEPIRHALLARCGRLELPRIELGVGAGAGTRGHGLASPDRVKEVLAAVLSQVILATAEDRLSNRGIAA
jgi:hypothetical protein